MLKKILSGTFILIGIFSASWLMVNFPFETLLVGLAIVWAIMIYLEDRS